MYEICHFNYLISDYLSNEVSNVNTIRERILYSSTRMGEQYFASVYRVYYVNIGTILMCISELKYTIQHKEGFVRLIIFVRYSWEVVLNVGLDT